MQHVVDAFAAALEADLLTADDFRRARRLAVALDDAVGDQARAGGAARRRARRRSRRALAVGDHLQRPGADLLEGAGRGDPVAERLGAGGVEGAEVGGSEPGSDSAARISGRVTVPSSRSVPRALPVRSGGPATSSTSSRSWKARPISAPKAPSASASRPRRQAHSKRARGLQPAALQVALLGDRGVVGVLALGQLAAGERDRGRGEQLDRARVAGRGEQREGAGEEQVAGRDGARRGRRRRPRSAGRGAAARRRGRRRGRASPCGRARPRPRRAPRRRRRRGRRRAGPASGAGACRPPPASRRRRRRAARRGRRPARAAAPRPRRGGPVASGSRRRAPP